VRSSFSFTASGIGRRASTFLCPSRSTSIWMKEAAGREKDLEDIRQLRLLMEHPDGER
jgi:hypothetical protein